MEDPYKQNMILCVVHRHLPVLLLFTSFSSWWFQPTWKIFVKLDHLPKYGKKWKIFETTTEFCKFTSILCRSTHRTLSLPMMESNFPPIAPLCNIASTKQVSACGNRKSTVSGKKQTQHSRFSLSFEQINRKRTPVILYDSGIVGRICLEKEESLSVLGFYMVILYCMFTNSE